MPCTAMKIKYDQDVPMPSRSDVKHDFSGATPGSSIWVKSNNERVKMMKAFTRWKDRVSSPIEAKSGYVDESDPRGEGYRIWFTKKLRMKE